MEINIISFIIIHLVPARKQTIFTKRIILDEIFTFWRFSDALASIN